MNNRHKKMGYNAAQELIDRQNHYFEEALAQQGKLGEPVKLPENRREFWRILDEMGMANAMKWALEERERR